MEMQLYRIRANVNVSIGLRVLGNFVGNLFWCSLRASVDIVSHAFERIKPKEWLHYRDP